jgi:hypothetical protein
MIYNFNGFDIKAIKIGNGIVLCDLSEKVTAYYLVDGCIHDKDLVEDLFYNYALTHKNFIEQSKSLILNTPA